MSSIKQLFVLSRTFTEVKVLVRDIVFNAKPFTFDGVYAIINKKCPTCDKKLFTRVWEDLISEEYIIPSHIKGKYIWDA